jgi:hypothetical protein
MFTALLKNLSILQQLTTGRLTILDRKICKFNHSK